LGVFKFLEPRSQRRARQSSLARWKAVFPLAETKVESQLSGLAWQAWKFRANKFQGSQSMPKGATTSEKSQEFSLARGHGMEMLLNKKRNSLKIARHPSPTVDNNRSISIRRLKIEMVFGALKLKF